MPTPSSLPKITEKTIKDRVGDRGLVKGRPYAHNGSVFDTKRVGTVLRARVQGQMSAPYRVSVTLDASGVRGAECSCPVGGGGYCKHVAAVLLVFKERPETFLEVEDLDTVLKKRGKDELIALVHQMLRRAPELEVLLEVPLTSGQAGKGPPLTPDVFRRQAEAAFRLAGDDWRASYGVASDLEAIKDLGDGYLKEGQVASAEAVFVGTLQGIAGEYGEMSDDEGEVAAVAAACCEGLGVCLQRETDPERRLVVLKALFDLYHQDVELGGIGMGDEVPGLIVEHASALEKRTVASWVRQALATTGGPTPTMDHYGKRVLGAFLLDLEGDDLDVEGYLRVCRETGRLADLVDKLLELGRMDEALTEASATSTHERIEYADIFLKHGHAGHAETLVREMLGKPGAETRALQWLKRLAKTRKDNTAVLDFAQRLFSASKTVEQYKELRDAAGKKAWPKVRAQALACLDPQRDGHTLVRIALDEGDVDRALEIVESSRPGFFGPLKLDVASAAESKRPEAALAIYKDQAERLIAMQGRGNYQSACTLLERVRAIHRKKKDETGWSRYRDELIMKNKRLSAFHDELARAKLS